jgi:hypothetical protein
MATPTARPNSLGDANALGLLRVKESTPLPPKRELIIEEMNRILGMGLVQKLTVEVGQPIVYERLVKMDEADPNMEVVEKQDLYGAVRNAEIVDFREADDFRGRGPFGVVFFALQDLLSRGAVPTAFLSSNLPLVWAWMGLPLDTHFSHLFAVPVFSYPDKQLLPDDALLLIGGDVLDPDTVKVTLRIAIDLPRKKR